MTPTRVLLPVVVAALITLGGRTGMPWVPLVDRGPSVEQYGERILALPERIGDWRLVEEDQLAAEAIRELRCGNSYVARRYVHNHHGGAVDLTLLAGPRGPVTAHSPDICYSANNYRMVSNTPFSVSRSDGDEDDQFRLVQLKSARSEERDLVVAYAWNDGRFWSVPWIPRMAYTSRDAVVKIQLAVPRANIRGAMKAEELIRDFLRPLLAQLDQSLFHELHQKNPSP